METPYGSARHSSFGVQVPQYFYIKQERPTPMPPLKVRYLLSKIVQKSNNFFSYYWYFVQAVYNIS